MSFVDIFCLMPNRTYTNVQTVSSWDYIKLTMLTINESQVTEWYIIKVKYYQTKQHKNTSINFGS
jgi:hypothetical protein